MIRLKANIKIRNDDGKTAAQLAQSKGFNDIASLLLQNGG
jgi:ankyrin repeat protein